MASRQGFIVAAAALSGLVLAPYAVQAAPSGGASLIVLYNTPKDAAAFDKYYFETHAPLAKKLPGLRSYTVSKGPIATPGSTTPQEYHLYAELRFDSLAAIGAAFDSPQGKIVLADLPNFASAGTLIRTFETTEV